MTYGDFADPECPDATPASDPRDVLVRAGELWRADAGRDGNARRSSKA